MELSLASPPCGVGVGCGLPAEGVGMRAAEDYENRLQLR